MCGANTFAVRLTNGVAAAHRRTLPERCVTRAVRGRRGRLEGGAHGTLRHCGRAARRRRRLEREGWEQGDCARAAGHVGVSSVSMVGMALVAVVSSTLL